MVVFKLQVILLGELQLILRLVHRMTPKSPWTLQEQRHPIYVLLVAYQISSVEYQISIHFALWPTVFELQAISL